MENNLELNVEYVVISYQYLYGSCGGYYIIRASRLLNEELSRTRHVFIIRDGHIFDYLEKMRKTNVLLRFRIKKVILDNNESYISINNSHLGVDLS